MNLMKRSLIVATLIAVAPLVLAQAEDGYSISTDHIYGHKAGMALTFDVVRPTDNANGVALSPHQLLCARFLLFYTCRVL